MPSLVTFKGPVAQLDKTQQSTTIHGATTPKSSMAEVDQLLEGVSFESFDKESQISTLRLAPSPFGADLSTSNDRNDNTTMRCIENCSRDDNVSIREDDPDVTTLDDTDIEKSISYDHLATTTSRSAGQGESQSFLFDPDVSLLNHYEQKQYSKASLRCSANPFAHHSFVTTGSYNSRKESESMKELKGDFEYNRRMTKDEQLYKQQYDSKILKIIQAFDQRQPGVLLGYASLSHENKRTEMLRVNQLLKRIQSDVTRFADLPDASLDQSSDHLNSLSKEESCTSFIRLNNSWLPHQSGKKESSIIASHELIQKDTSNVDTVCISALRHQVECDLTADCKQSLTAANHEKHLHVQNDSTTSMTYLEVPPASAQVINESCLLDTSMALLSPTVSKPIALGNPSNELLPFNPDVSISLHNQIGAVERNSNTAVETVFPFSNLQGLSTMRPRITYSVTKSPYTPSRVSQKRMAVESGRKGFDTTRFKLDCDSDDESIESIEQVRRGDKASSSPMMFSAPLNSNQMRHRYKSMAAMSGNTGKNAVSHVESSGSQCFVYEDNLEFSSDEASTSSLQNERKSSPEAAVLFSSSQSPILHNATRILPSGFDVEDMSECLKSPLQDLDDTIFSVEDFSSTYRCQKVRWNIGEIHDSHLQEIPANISMARKARFKINPLKVRSLKTSRREQDPNSEYLPFPDPLEKYSGSEGRKIKAVIDWVTAIDRQSMSEKLRPTKSGIVFSMKPHHIRDTVLKILLSLHALRSPESCTLVVCRSKDETERFARALREGSSFSVLNHASLPLSERTRPRADINSTFDMVLSTFDALMSKDFVSTINLDGHVVRRDDKDNGWFSSRSSSSDEEEAVRVEKLSVLHMVDWRRVFFIDELGRKSYVAKAGTLRARAAMALNASARFVFFNEMEDDSSQWEALRKSDRRSFHSVAAVLRVLNDSSDEAIYRSAIDFKTIKV